VKSKMPALCEREIDLRNCFAGCTAI